MDSPASLLEKPVLSGICSHDNGEVLMVSPLFEGEELLISNNGDFQAVNAIRFEPQPPSIAGPTAGSHNKDGEDEFFFDSKAWLGSDSEDEFYSVKGKGENPGISGSSSQDISFVESTPFIKPIGSQYSNQKTPPTEQKKELVELFQDPHWNDLLVNQHHNVLSIYSEKQLFEFFRQDKSWSDQSITDPTSFSHTPSIVDSKSLESSIIEFPSDTTSRRNSMDGNERSQKYKSKSKKNGCCTCIPRFSPRVGVRK